VTANTIFNVIPDESAAALAEAGAIRHPVFCFRKKEIKRDSGSIFFRALPLAKRKFSGMMLRVGMTLSKDHTQFTQQHAA